MLSRRGVSSDLQTSPYVVELLYEDENRIAFYFSSKLHFNKFNDRFINKRIDLMYSLQNRFKINISLDILSDILLYKSIEHRGFYIRINDEVVTCLNNIELDGKLKILKNYQE